MLSDEEKEAIQKIVQDAKEVPPIAYVAALFMTREQKAYMMVRLAIARQTHPCKQESASTQADSVEPDNRDARKCKSLDGLSSLGSEATHGGA